MATNGRNAASQQCVSRAREPGLVSNGMRFFGGAVFFVTIAAARRPQKAFHIRRGHRSGVACAQKRESWHVAARVMEQFEQFFTGERVKLAARLDQFEKVLVPVAAPVQDVIAAARLDLLDEPLTRHAVGEKIDDDIVVAEDFRLEQASQLPALAPRRQRPGRARRGEDEQNAQWLSQDDGQRIGRRALGVIADAQAQIGFGEAIRLWRSTGDFPGRAGERHREVSCGIVPVEDNAQRAGPSILPKRIEYFASENVPGDNDADFLQFSPVFACRIMASQPVASVEELVVARTQRIATEIHRALRDLHTKAVLQGKIRRQIFGVSRDGELKI
jgi:hypothetical protein